MKKSTSLAQPSNDLSSTKEYSNAMNTFINQNQNTPSSTNLSKIKIKKIDSNHDLPIDNNDFQKNNNNSNSVSANSKSLNKKIIINSAKSFSAKPTKYYSDFQKGKKMKLIDLNSNSKSISCKDNYINNSLRPSKISPKVSNTQSKINNIAMNKSSKNFFSNSQGFTCFSKSFHKKYKVNKKPKPNNFYSLNKSSSKSWKNSGRTSKSNSFRKYSKYLIPTYRQYLGIDLNLISNSSHIKIGEINSQMNRYLKNYNYNNDDDENFRGEEEILDYDLKSNDNYFFPKRTENDEDNDNYLLNENNFDNKNKNSFKDLDGEENKNIINLNINKDISKIEPTEKNDVWNLKNSNIKKEALNQYINKYSLNKPPFPRKIRKEEFNNSFSNIRHQDNTSINQINQSTPVSSFHMYPYEAESSPTNYIKSISNANNLTYMTNNSKKYNNKNKGNNLAKEPSECKSYLSIKDDEQKSYSHFNFNQSECTNNNSIYKIPGKVEEKRICEKLENNHKIKNKENRNNIDEKRINNRPQNTIEEKDEESEYLDKINSNLLSKEKDIKKSILNKNSDFIQISQESNFPESELLNESKKLNEFINDENRSNSKIGVDKDIIKLDKKYDDSILNIDYDENKEMMERLQRLRKEKEKNEEIEKEEKILKKRLEEEKYKKKMEEERIKILRKKEEEEKRIFLEKEEEKLKNIKKKEKHKLNELIKIKEEIKKEEQQRISLEKEAELLEKKIKIKDINRNNEILTNYPNVIVNNLSKSIKTKSIIDNKYFYNYNLTPSKIEDLDLKNKDILINSLNKKEEIMNKKTYINNPINSSKYLKRDKEEKPYNYDYGLNSNIENQIFNYKLRNKNDINNKNNNNLINNNDILNNIPNFEQFKKIIHEKREKNDNNKKINKIPYNKSFYRSNSQIQIEILSKENNKKYNMNNSFSSFNFKIDNQSKNSNKKNICLINNTNDNSIGLNNKEKNDKIDNTIFSINNNSYNNSIISPRIKEKSTKSKTKDVSTQYQDYSINNNNKNISADKNNNLFFKKYISNNKGVDNTIKSEFDASISNYSKSNNNDLNSENNNKSEYYNPKYNMLFEYDKFKKKYDKLNSNKKRNKSISNIHKMFDSINNNTNYTDKKCLDDEKDDFYKKKKYIDINKVIDNKISLYSKIPHHHKNERNKSGLWSDYSIYGYNKSSNNNVGLTDQSTSIYSLNSLNKSIKNRLNRKINTSVFPANPFDSVNEAREYFFFND